MGTGREDLHVVNGRKQALICGANANLPLKYNLPFIHNTMKPHRTADHNQDHVVRWNRAILQTSAL